MTPRMRAGQVSPPFVPPDTDNFAREFTRQRPHLSQVSCDWSPWPQFSPLIGPEQLDGPGDGDSVREVPRRLQLLPRQLPLIAGSLDTLYRAVQ